MIRELLKKGRNHLERGELIKAKEVCKEIAVYLDFYIIEDKDWKIIDTFLKEILLLQEIDKWKKEGKKEYEELSSLVKNEKEKEAPRTSAALESLEKFLQ
jgi:hypothetical protein